MIFGMVNNASMIHVESSPQKLQVQILSNYEEDSTSGCLESGLQKVGLVNASLLSYANSLCCQSCNLKWTRRGRGNGRGSRDPGPTMEGLLS